MNRFSGLFALTVFLAQTQANALAETQANALEYRVKVLDALPNAEYSYATDINNHGQVVGRTRFRAFYWDSQRGVVDVGAFPGAEYATADAINDQGQVVGHSGGHAFIWSADTGMQRLVGVPGYSGASDINDSGSVVGWNSESAFYWDPENGMDDLQERVAIPSYHSITADAINNKGQIAGLLQSLEATGDYRAFFLDGPGPAIPLDFGSHGSLYYVADLSDSGIVAANVWTPQGFRAYVWSEIDGVTELGFFPDLFEPRSHISGINNVGQAVGMSSGWGFVWDRESGLQRLHEAVIRADPTIAWFEPIAINDSGAIVGTSAVFVNDEIETRVVVITPVPEPSSILMTCAGLLSILVAFVWHAR